MRNRPPRLPPDIVQGDPAKAKDSYEAKLVRLLREVEHSVTLITMDMLHTPPQAWSQTEWTFTWCVWYAMCTFVS